MNLEYSYYTDASHNYLAVRCPEEEGSRNYQIRMLTRNRIEGLLPCTRLSVGEDEDLYYDITSRQSLKNLYDNRTMTGAELKHFLEEMLAMDSEVILEIKFQDAYPLWLAEILSHLRLQKTSFSKYGRVYRLTHTAALSGLVRQEKTEESKCLHPYLPGHHPDFSYYPY